MKLLKKPVTVTGIFLAAMALFAGNTFITSGEGQEAAPCMNVPLPKCCLKNKKTSEEYYPQQSVTNLIMHI